MNWEEIADSLIGTSIERQVSFHGHRDHFHTPAQFIAQIGIVGLFGGRQLGATEAAFRIANRKDYVLVTSRQMFHLRNPKYIASPTAEPPRVICIEDVLPGQTNVLVGRNLGPVKGIIFDGSSLFKFKRDDIVSAAQYILDNSLRNLKANNPGVKFDDYKQVPVVVLG